jgi:hypothetical protein
MNFNIFNMNVPLLVLLIIVVLIILDTRKDNFDGLHDMDINNEKYTSFIKDEECCLVEKKLAKDGSGFYYDYKVVKCDQNNPRYLNHNFNDRRLIPSSQMDMKMCNKENSNLGSCRKSNHECFDFFTKEQCDKYEKMIWDKIPCNMPYRYVNKVEPYKIFEMNDIKQEIKN